MAAETPRAARAPSSSVLTESRAARGQAPGTGNTGRGLPVPGCHITLTPGQLDLVLEALEDAAEYRASTQEDCDFCAGVGWSAPCPDHVADAARAERYAGLARRLRKAAGHD